MDPGGQWLVHGREWVNLREFRGCQFGQSRWGGRWDVVVMRAGSGNPGRGKSLSKGMGV